MENQIVAFGPAGAERVGIVVGKVDHFLHGESYLVRTPTAILKDQMADVAPVKFGIRSATSEELEQHAQSVIERAKEALMKEMRAHLLQANGATLVNGEPMRESD
jgi:hypothetical protein